MGPQIDGGNAHGAATIATTPFGDRFFTAPFPTPERIYLVDLRRTDADGYLEKTLVLDLLSIRDPNGVSLPARPGEFGVGDPFSFPLQSVESLEVLDKRHLLVANDNNYPGSDGRWAARNKPDDTELIVVRVPSVK